LEILFGTKKNVDKYMKTKVLQEKQKFL